MATTPDIWEDTIYYAYIDWHFTCVLNKMGGVVGTDSVNTYGSSAVTILAILLMLELRFLLALLLLALLEEFAVMNLDACWHDMSRGQRIKIISLCCVLLLYFDMESSVGLTSLL